MLRGVGFYVLAASDKHEIKIAKLITTTQRINALLVACVKVL